MATKIIDDRASSQSVDRSAIILQLEQLQGRLATQLTPILAALELLADSQRVLNGIYLAADEAPASAKAEAEQLARMLSEACPSWRNPQRYDGEDGALDCCQGLALVAVNLSAEIARETENALLKLRRSELPA